MMSSVQERWRLKTSVLKWVLGQLVAHGTIYFSFSLWTFMATNCLYFSASFPQPNSTLGNGLLVLLEAIKGSRNLTKTTKIIAYFAYLFQPVNLTETLLPQFVCWAGGDSACQIHKWVWEKDSSCINQADATFHIWLINTSFRWRGLNLMIDRQTPCSCALAAATTLLLVLQLRRTGKELNSQICGAYLEVSPLSLQFRPFLSKRRAEWAVLGLQFFYLDDIFYIARVTLDYT